MAQEEPLENPKKEEELPNFAEEAFDIDLLREMILEKVILGEDKKISWSSVRALRLVQKSWLKTTTKLFEILKIPLFQLRLSTCNSLNKNVGARGKLLDRFTNAVMTCSMSTGPTVPSFSVIIMIEVLEEENHVGLSNLLVHCGAGMTELNLALYQDEASVTLMFPSFSLPNLRKLTLEPMNCQLSDNLAHFVNSLLNAASSLEEFIVYDNPHHDFEHGLLDFQFFTLPPTITTLMLGCDLTIANLEILFKNQLPLLTSLALLIPNETSFPDGLLFRILDKFRATLTTLTLYTCDHEELEFVSKLRFPVMEKLEEVWNFSINCDLEDGIRSLEGFLPKLSKLALTNQTIDMFRKWSETSRFESVQYLELSLANEMVSHYDDQYGVGVNLERMQRVHLTFPNVRKLDVSIDPRETCGLKYVFMEMRKLTHLKIEVVYPDTDWDTWDALLIGAPEKFVAGLRECPEYWNQVQLATDQFPSIKDLQDLTYLCLQSFYFYHNPSTNSLISDLTFHFALLQMPRLQELTLGTKFEISRAMQTKWRNEGRKLKCNW